MPKQCVANLDVINTIPKAILSRRISELSTTKLAEVANAIRFALDM
jgi:mRNA-degrading endonuclease toxin of MazEF toxin-antitoxin module